MSHWAELDNSNKVIRVIVGDNNDPAGDEGYSWIVKNLGGRWVKTSYNGSMRKNFAAIGGTYDPVLDAFIPKKLFASWTLDKETCTWVPPIPYPELPEGTVANWNEETQTWDKEAPNA